jgi:HSP20 family molecular chaperone IbpA
MSDPRDFDDMFGDIWGDEEFVHIIADQRNMERTFREFVKNLIKSLKKAKLQGRSEFIPIERPGMRGFIFRQEFGTPEISQEEKKGSAIVGETSKVKQGFTLPDSTTEAKRKPILETLIDGDEFVALVELPGTAEHDITLKIEENLIEVSALNFKTAQIRVPLNADTSKTTKTYKNGVLEIRVPLSSQTKRDEGVRFGVA